MTPPLCKKRLSEEEVAWLFTGAEAPLHTGVRAAVNEYLEQHTCGSQGRVFKAQIEDSCRAKFARLLGSAVRALIVGYEGAAQFAGNNRDIAKWARERDWIAPLAYYDAQKPQRGR